MSEQDRKSAASFTAPASGDPSTGERPREGDAEVLAESTPPGSNRQSEPDVYAESEQLHDADAPETGSAGNLATSVPPWATGIAWKGAAALPEPDVPLLTWTQRRRLEVADAMASTPGMELAEKILSALVILGVTVFVVWQLRPDLLFGPNMDVGGDNGGHVAAPYFMIHQLLNHGRLTGWDPWWFDGFPLYVFYFPLPALMVAVLNVVFPYAVAFKLVTVAGTVTLPVCVWAFGCLAGFRRPVPVLMAAAMLPYLFNTSYTIDGGNITSTMAGEFSFSLAMSFGVLFLGVLMYALRTGRLRWLAAALFAATVLCHVVPAIAFAAVAILLALSMSRLSTLKVLIPVGIVGALLAAFWLLPFGAYISLSSSMGYNRIPGIKSSLVPAGAWWFLVPAIMGGIIAVVRRDRFASVLAAAALGSGIAFGYLPSGAVYNGRWLPFWFLFVLLVAAYGIAQLFFGLAFLLANPWVRSVGTVLGTVACVAGAAQAGGLVGAFPGIGPNSSQTQVQGWINWNYTGFQGKSGWTEFQGMINMLDRAGAQYGCGRLQYEYISETTDPFGSTEAMMALPMWTKGCMETTDGIYFESSTTTPFHFLNVSEVSQIDEAPDPVSGLAYPGFNLPDGIRHLQLMGVRYFLAMSPPVEAAAAADPSLREIAQTTGFPGNINGLADPHPVWKLYLIENSPLVSALAYYPVVEPSSAHTFMETNLRWYESESYWPVELTRSGPASWQHAPAGRLVPASNAVPADGTTVSDIRQTDSSISFDVTQLGSPVAVKIPYFPNWQATGATGPYEASPNVMVVVPTSHHVALAYGTTGVDWAGKAASLLGLVALGVLIMRPAVEVGPDPTAPKPLPLQPSGASDPTVESTSGSEDDDSGDENGPAGDGHDPSDDGEGTDLAGDTDGEEPVGFMDEGSLPP